MDFLRSCYRVPMRMGPGREPVWVQWYFAPGGALVMPLWHVFGSRNYSDREASATIEEIGEVGGPRIWVDGSTPANAAGLTGSQRSRDCAEEHAAWWEAGLPDGAETGPYDAQGRPLCCLPEPDSPCTPDPCDCTLLVNDPAPDEAQWGTQCPFLGPTMIWTKDGDCHWSGTWFTWSGDFTQRMSHAGGTWTWEIDTSPPRTFTTSGDTCPPVAFEFNVPSIDTQPFSFGIPCTGDVVLRFEIAYP